MSKGYFHDFQKTLEAGDTLAVLRKWLVGEGVMVEGPMGPKKMIYADYIASGRALMQVEWAVLNDILPYYANSHTEGSLCGATMTRLRREARAFIAGECGADERHAVIFTGSGATSALNRIVGLLGVNDAVARGETPLVLIGPYEHHSNILPWRESGAEVIEIPEAVNGGPDLAALEAALKGGQGRLMIGSFSAASNVSGIVADVTKVTRLLKRHGALAVLDYAGGGPYLTVDMAAGTDTEIDAVALSPHKFVGDIREGWSLRSRRRSVRIVWTHATIRCASGRWMLGTGCRGCRSWATPRPTARCRSSRSASLTRRAKTGCIRSF